MFPFLQTQLRLFIKIVIPATLVLYAVACATIVTPTGGPKDITPPVMLGSNPQNLSTNFNGKKIVINFDEYIVLKTPEKFLLISPPMKEMPDISVKGHAVIIKIADTLRDNTTYNFYLGEAIVDIAENNPVANFNFAFSTGPDIDSLSLSGNVTDAFSRMPVKAALVMLYNDFTDSVPMKQIPMYVSRTTDKGNFRFNNLASGKYRAVALIDGNSDYMYNLPTEMIGFSSDSVQPYYNAIDLSDTNAVKKADSTIQNLVSINLFPEPDSIQRIVKSVLSAKNRISVFFRYPMKKPGLRALNVPDSLPWALQEWNPSLDTLNAWLVNKPDTLNLEISERGVVLDTVTISTNMKVTAKTRTKEAITAIKAVFDTVATPANPKIPGRSRVKDAAAVLNYTTSLSNGWLGCNNPLIISFSNPVDSCSLKSIQLICMTKLDTVTITPQARFMDTIHRHLEVIHKWNSTDIYDLYIPEGSFTDIYGNISDSAHTVFRMKPLEEYGRFAVTINRREPGCPILVQLLNEKGLALNQQVVTTGKRVDFGLLPPAKYGLKAIMDANGNGRWDTGVFLKKIQPEIVLIHPNIFQVRTNWELEETWDF